jgi:hypothetical protein
MLYSSKDSFSSTDHQIFKVRIYRPAYYRIKPYFRQAVGYKVSSSKSFFFMLIMKSPLILMARKEIGILHPVSINHPLSSFLSPSP